MDYDKFVEDYIKALKDLDATKVVSMIDSLKTAEESAKALELVLEALGKDEELIKNNPKIIEILEALKESAKADIPAETKEEVKETSEVEADSKAEVTEA